MEERGLILSFSFVKKRDIIERILIAIIGLGTLLMPIITLFFPLTIAIAIVHFSNNLFEITPIKVTVSSVIVIFLFLESRSKLATLLMPSAKRLF